MEILAHFNEVAIRLKQECHVDFTQHDGFLECVSLQTRLYSLVPLLLFRQRRFERL